MGMGMAYTAVGDDPSAMYFNPGGLAGSDLTEFGGSVGRMYSPVGPLSFVTATYIRPLPLRPNSVVGASFMTLRENNGGDKDQFLLHYSEPMKLPQLQLTRPAKLGANLKFINLDGGTKGEKFGLGLDLGAVLESDFGLRFGASLTDLTMKLGVPNPSLNLGLGYSYDWVTVATDLRVRQGATEFYPGVEGSFFHGLLKARLGKGMPLHGVSQVAFGVGFNVSPVIIDYAMTIPFKGINHAGGAYQMTLNYKFDAPVFYGRFVGAAAKQAEEIKMELLRLEDRRKTLEAQTQTTEAAKLSLEGELRSMESRAKSLQEEVRALEIQAEQLHYKAAQPRLPKETPPPPPPKPAAPRFPRPHAVVPGDTLRSLAAMYYGDPNLWELIYDANPDKIDRGLPQEGSVLTIPPPVRH